MRLPLPNPVEIFDRGTHRSSADGSKCHPTGSGPDTLQRIVLNAQTLAV
jgi:hypothetical protein